METSEIIVTALSILVTILMGWNIYQIIDVNGLKKEYKILFDRIEQETNYLHNKAEYNTALFYGRISQMIGTHLSKVNEEDLIAEMLFSGLISIKMFVQLGHKSEYKSIANTLCYSMNGKFQTHICYKHAKECFAEMHQIDETEHDELFMILRPIEDYLIESMSKPQ